MCSYDLADDEDDEDDIADDEYDEDSDSDGEGILANLAAEDEELPEEMRKEAVDKLEAELREMEAKAKK